MPKKRRIDVGSQQRPAALFTKRLPLPPLLLRYWRGGELVLTEQVADPRDERLRQWADLLGRLGIRVEAA